MPQELPNTRAIRGAQVRRSHGNSGVVRAKFARSIPPKAGGWGGMDQQKI